MNTKIVTTIERRDRYAAAHPGDPRPSRFTHGADYQLWAARADAWFASEETLRAGSPSEPIAERDGWMCTCAHKNVSHGYGAPLSAVYGSRIGMGACGYDDDPRDVSGVLATAFMRYKTPPMTSGLWHNLDHKPTRDPKPYVLAFDNSVRLSVLDAYWQSRVTVWAPRPEFDVPADPILKAFRAREVLNSIADAAAEWLEMDRDWLEVLTKENLDTQQIDHAAAVLKKIVSVYS